MTSHRVVHLSDVHLTASGHDEDGVDAVRALRLVLESLVHVRDVDVVVVSGDIADDGSAKGCRLAREMIGAWAADRATTCVFSTGNHDRRGPFAAALGSGHHTTGGDDIGEPGPPGTCTAVSTTRGLRVVTLDSLVVGSSYGELGDDQLTWLADLLATPAPAGTLLVLHHPPLVLESHPLTEAVLQRPERLAAVIDGTDVRAVLTGHLHHALGTSLAGVPVWVTPGVVTRVDVSAPDHLLRGVLGGGASLVDLPAAGAPVFRPVDARDPRRGEQVYLVDFATMEFVASEV